MKRNEKIFFLILILFSILIPAMPVNVLANAAEPPSLVIIVVNPLEDLSIKMVSDGKVTEAKVRQSGWERYYVFYRRDMEPDSVYTFSAVTNGESFDFVIDKPLKYYNNIYTLDLSRREITEGKYPFRSAILVSVRVIITLVLEGIVFWLFGFRQKRSWLTFLCVNLVTQGILNIWLNNIVPSPVAGYLVISLFIGEFFVFIAEIVMFPILLKENRNWRFRTLRILLYVLFANIVSLVAGSYIITNLPV